jgi:hypothetical protein
MAFDAYPSPPNHPASFARYHSEQGISGAADAGLLQALAQTNDFTIEDLQVNHQGWMSARQREQAKRSQGSTIGCLILALITVGSTVVGGGGALLAGIGGPGAMNGFSLLALVVVALGLSVLLTFLAGKGAKKQLGDGRVTFLDGFVERERHESPNGDGATSTSYTYVVYQPQSNAVQQQRFSVNGAAFHALRPGLRYRIYYVPASNKLVSIEPLP